MVVETEVSTHTVRLFGIGNPLLDYIVYVDPDEDIHARYNVNLEDAILAAPEHMPIYKEVSSRPGTKLHAGGSALNTLKMVQWISRAGSHCTYVGCIDRDEAGQILQKECGRLHLDAKLQFTDRGSGTGRCAVLVSGKCRSLVTHLGACQDLQLKHLEEESVWRVAEEATLIYSTGYVIATCYDGLLKLAQHSVNKHKPFFFNLSAPFVSTFYTKQIDSILPFVSVIFGNSDEARAYAGSHSSDVESMSLESVAQLLANRLIRTGTSLPCLAIVTNGKGPVVVAKPQNPSAVQTFPVPDIADDEIVDTNGAGDAFVAGFITQYVQSPDNIDSAIQAAIKAAGYLIRQVGFSLGPRELYD